MIIELQAIEKGIGQTFGNIVGEISAIVFGFGYSLILYWKLTLNFLFLYPFWIGIQLFALLSSFNVTQRKRALLEKTGAKKKKFYIKLKL